MVITFTSSGYDRALIASKLYNSDNRTLLGLQNVIFRGTRIVMTLPVWYYWPIRYAMLWLCYWFYLMTSSNAVAYLVC